MSNLSVKNLLGTTAGIGCLTVASVLSFSSSAVAASFGTSWDGEEYSLQNLLDGITKGGPGIDTLNDQTGFDWFTNTASGGSLGSFMFEVAGFAPTNKFGIYNSSKQKALLYYGVNNPGDRVTIDFLAGGDISVSTKGLPPGDVTPTADIYYSDFGNLFGFYLEREDGTTFYTQNALNDGGYQQAVVYQGDNRTTLALPGKQGGTFTDNEFIIAFEDLWLGGSTDRDYNDLVVMMESVEPIPEPATVIGLGLVAGSFAILRRRQSQKL